MNSEITKESEILAILTDLCGRMAVLGLRIIGEDTPKDYESRFLRFYEDPQSTTVTVEAPVLKKRVVPLKLDQEVEVSFSHNNKPHLFVTLVSGNGKFKLDSRTTLPSLELLAPKEITAEEKRNFYRLRPDENNPIEVKLGILAEDEGQMNRIRSRGKGIITNIGGDGLGFRISEGKSLFLNSDTRVQVKFCLNPQDDEVSMLALVRFRLRRPNAREVFFGLQFIEIDSDIKYKKSVDKILRFVAEEQRRHLAKHKHRNQ